MKRIGLAWLAPAAVFILAFCPVAWGRQLGPQAAPAAAAPHDTGNPGDRGEFPPGRHVAGGPALSAPERLPRPAGMAGSSDDFGYTLDAGGGPLQWIDTGGGPSLPLYTECDALAAVPIGFAFKYYENTYVTAYVGYTGFIAFAPAAGCSYALPVPSPALPNNTIAPYAGDFADATIAHVRYVSGGSAPNRYLAVEWNQVPDWYDAASSYTFQAVLHENGDVRFQYQAMTYGGNWACAGTGIEDARGADGLRYQFCARLGSQTALAFSRPGPSARVSVYPLHQGRLTHAGEVLAFQVPIYNTGETGADTYDVGASSSWQASLYAADGITPLADSNGNGTPDTGPVAPGEAYNLVVKVQVPPAAAIGDRDRLSLMIRSSLDPAESKTADLRAAVPAPFARTYTDAPDRAMELYLAQPGGQTLAHATAASDYGYEPSVVEAAGGNFAYFWYRGRCLDRSCDPYVSDVEYALLDRWGRALRPVAKLTDNGGASINTYDYDPVAAATPDGHVGVSWRRELYDRSTGQMNYNVFFAVLDASGTVVAGPFNVTNNGTWGTWRDPFVPQFYSSHVAGTGDNRFVLTWEADSHNSANQWLSDVYYAIYAEAGVIKPATPLTAGAYGAAGYSYPFVTGLAGGRGLLTLAHDDDIYYAVLAGDGSVYRSLANLSGDGSSTADAGTPAAAQLADGRVLVAWTVDGSAPALRFATLDAGYNRLGGPTALANPYAVTGDAAVAVVPDQAGHAILTWTDSAYSSRAALYYALVGGDGKILTEPQIFYASSVPGSLSTGAYGNAATTYHYGLKSPQAFLPSAWR